MPGVLQQRCDEFHRETMRNHGKLQQLWGSHMVPAAKDQFFGHVVMTVTFTESSQFLYDDS